MHFSAVGLRASINTVAQTCLAPIGDVARFPNGSRSEPAVKANHRETHSAAHP